MQKDAKAIRAGSSPLPASSGTAIRREDGRPCEVVPSAASGGKQEKAQFFLSEFKYAFVLN
jgi:hypothetical protein